MPRLQLADVMRLPFELAIFDEEDIIVCALVSKQVQEAVLESLAALTIPRPRLQLLVRDPRRLAWAVNDLGVSVGEDTARTAAAEGALASLEWLRGQDGHTAWGSSMTAAAASFGQLDVLKWLRKNDCPWGKETTSLAEINGHSELKAWAIDNGCEYSEQHVMRCRILCAASLCKDVIHSKTTGLC